MNGDNEYWHQFARFHNFLSMAENQEKYGDILKLANLYRSIALDALDKMNRMLAGGKKNE